MDGIERQCQKSVCVAKKILACIISRINRRAKGNRLTDSVHIPCANRSL